MKKFVALLMVALLVCGSIGSAMAQQNFRWSGGNADFEPWTTIDGIAQYARSNGSNWHITWESSNISSSHRAVVRIFTSTGDYASSKWVYSTQSTAYHPYKDGCGGGKTDTGIWGRLDDRDSGTLSVKGVFYN